MRERVGMVLQVVGLILMPLAVIQGMTGDGALGPELLGAAVGLLLVFIGRGLRGGGRAS